jgi:hypothetical protein
MRKKGERRKEFCIFGYYVYKLDTCGVARAEDGDFGEKLTCSIGDEKQQQYYRCRSDAEISHNFLRKEFMMILVFCYNLRR